MGRCAFLIGVTASVARRSGLVVGLYAEAELGVCRGLAKEVRKTLVELVLPIARRVDIANPDSLIGLRVRREVLPDGPVNAERGFDVWWYNERFVENIRYLLRDLRHDLTLVDEPPQSLLVGLRVLASGPSRCEPLRKRFVIDGFHDAIDPAEAERLLDGVVVRNPRPSRMHTVVPKPDFVLDLIVHSKPPPPCRPVIGTQDFSIHPDSVACVSLWCFLQGSHHCSAVLSWKTSFGQPCASGNMCGWQVRICAVMGGWSEGLGCVSCLVRLVASRLLSHGDDSLPLGVSVSEVAHGIRDLVERVGPVYDGGDIRGFDQLFEL
jgi:hypothetical protein